jgi:hypothetical protein
MAMEQHSRFARAADRFVIGSGLLSVLGWTLALLQQLKPVPYVAGLGVLTAILVWMRFQRGESGRAWLSEFSRIKRRLRRPIFVVYAIVWVGALLGGSLYAPSNYDALSYRIPQLLHWVAEGGWHWIDAPNSRMNIAPPGMNWLIAPFYFLTKSDRPWFLVNLAAFSLLPGCLFEMFRRADASLRTAWWLMWLVPCSYSFALQAGSIGNDLLGTTYATASLAIALRARSSAKVTDLWLSGIAMAMATGVKSLNLPLLLPWAVIVWPVIHLTFKRRAATVGAALMAAFASCLPTTLLNLRETGNWTGDPKDEHRVHQPNAGVGVISNMVMLAVANTQPPILLNPSSWNRRFESWLQQTPFDGACRAAPRFELRWNELPTEELAGIGPGLLAVGGILISAILRQRQTIRSSRRRVISKLALAVSLAFLIFIARFSSEAVGRLSTAFVPVLTLFLLQLASRSDLFRRKWARAIAVISATLCLPGLVLSPARPLFPVNTLLSFSGSDSLSRIATVYTTYSQRSDCYAPLTEKLNRSDHPELLFSGGSDDPEAPAWKPYGSRKVRQWTELGSPIPIALASELGVRERFGMSWEDFLKQTGAEILDQRDLNIRAGRGIERWYLLRTVPTKR